ncbi:MAG: hypothetical protein ACTSXD_11860 [Candidatus Heimdallarchaeaceae archaeon]
MKLGVGLVVKGGEQFIEKWLECAEKIADVILVVHNDANAEVMENLFNSPKLKQYHYQKNMGRNMSRDYQKILEMAREENCDWLWNIDIDEYVPDINVDAFKNYLINSRDQSISFPFFEMRNDDKHYIMLRDPFTGKLKQARLCHKCYRVLSHLKFNEKDKHGNSIPHNCIPGKPIGIPVQHFGHYTRELRDEKRKQYDTKSFKDTKEQVADWMKEDDEVIIKKWEDLKDGKD